MGRDEERGALGERRIVRREGATIAYHVAGEGPAICLIASTGRGPDDFARLSAELVTRGYSVIAPEPRGIGGSSGTLEGVDFHDLAADAAAAVDAETDRAIMAGHAYGCWIARTLAADRPDLVRGVVMLAAGAGKWPAELSRAIDTLTGHEAGREARLEALRLAFFAPGSDPEPWLHGWHGDVVAAQRDARDRTERASWWATGTAPILDLLALEDPFRPAAHRKDFVREFGDRVTLRAIGGASHALPDEKPREVAEAIDAWARGLA